jgi:hypothetical protein
MHIFRRRRNTDAPLRVRISIATMPSPRLVAIHWHEMGPTTFAQEPVTGLATAKRSENDVDHTGRLGAITSRTRGRLLTPALPFPTWLLPKALLSAHLHDEGARQTRSAMVSSSHPLQFIHLVAKGCRSLAEVCSVIRLPELPRRSVRRSPDGDDLGLLGDPGHTHPPLTPGKRPLERSTPTSFEVRFSFYFDVSLAYNLIPVPRRMCRIVTLTKGLATPSQPLLPPRSEPSCGSRRCRSKACSSPWKCEPPS